MTTASHAQSEDFRSLVRSGLRWSFGSNILSRVTTLVTGIILARLLAPQDFGEFTVALVAIAILVNINDLGVEQALVRWPGDIARVARTATTVIFTFSAVLCLLCLAAAGVFASALGAPQATPIVQLLALGLLFNGAFAVPSAILTREFRQDKRTVADLTGFLVGTVLTVVLAVMGYGVWALAWGRFVGNATVSIMHWRLAPARYRPGWDAQIARELVRTSLPLGGAAVVAVLLLNVDYMLVGRLLGAEVLGYYTLAFNLASWPVAFFAVAVARVSVPAFARMQDDRPRLQAAYSRSSQTLLTLALPPCLLLALFADPLVHFVYGDKWAPAVAVLRFLAALGLLRVLYQFWADVLVAVGEGRRVLVTQLCWIASLAPALYLSIHWSLAGVGVAQVLVAVAVVGPIYAANLRGVVRLGPGLRGWARLTLASAAASAAGYAVLRTEMPPVWTLAVGTPVVLGVYLAVVWRLVRELGFDPQALVQALRRRAGSRRRFPRVPA